MQCLGCIDQERVEVPHILMASLLPNPGLVAELE